MIFHKMLLGKLDPALSGPDALASLPYERELALKREVFTDFWKEHKLGGEVLPLVAAPFPRRYRSTSKRRVTWLGLARVALSYETGKKAGITAASPLEPTSHSKVYRHCHQALSKTGDQSLAKSLNSIVVRGGEAGIAILVVDHLDAPVVRQAKRLVEGLPALGIASAMLYVDPTRSDSSLDAERLAKGLTVKHLYGPRLLTLVFDDAGTAVRLKYPPTAFSQANETMIPQLISTARELLAPMTSDRLLDLYCGYGLFSFTLGRECRSVVGVEMAGEALDAARETARRQEKPCRFIAGRIDAEGIESLLPAPAPSGEVLLLDPPPHKTDAEVIAALTRRQPRRVLHIACGTEELVIAINAWKASGYRVSRAVALDFFPGTLNVETLVALEPKQKTGGHNEK